jgi:hypothetical protein
MLRAAMPAELHAAQFDFAYALCLVALLKESTGFAPSPSRAIASCYKRGVCLKSLKV